MIQILNLNFYNFGEKAINLTAFFKVQYTQFLKRDICNQVYNNLNETYLFLNYFKTY